MPVTITKEDLKVQVSVNLDYAKHATGPLRVAAIRLAQLWLTQLTLADRMDIERSEGVSLEGF